MRPAPLRALAAATALAISAGAAADARRAVEDDWPRALAEAKRLGAPILVDVWAPW